jgi:hypothetical protein
LKITETRDGSILEVSVKPRSREFKIVLEGDGIVVFCREEPSRGKVNKVLLREFSKLFRKEVVLISGFTSKQKKLLIVGATKSQIEEPLLHK